MALKEDTYFEWKAGSVHEQPDAKKIKLFSWIIQE